MERGENRKTNPLLAGIAFLGALLPMEAGAQSTQSARQNTPQQYEASLQRAPRAPRESFADGCRRLIRDLPDIMRRTQNTDALEEIAGCEDFPGFQNVINTANQVDQERMAAARRRIRGNQ